MTANEVTYKKRPYTKINKKWILAVALTIASSLTVAAPTRSIRTANAPHPSPLQSPDQAPSAMVKIDNFSFGPGNLTISTGTTVTWTNNDDVPHTVVSDDKVFKSKALDTDDKFSYTFTKPGTYNYFCSVHPKMTAKIEVK